MLRLHEVAGRNCGYAVDLHLVDFALWVDAHPAGM